MIQVLLIDDDHRHSELLSAYCRRFDIELDCAFDGEEGLRRLGATRPDLLLLDVMLPGRDGFSLCREIRRRSRLPIIMLTARGDVLDRVTGLELGADDYISKPFEPRELVARIRAVLRTASGAAQAPARTRTAIGDWTFDRVQRRLHSPDGVMVPLSAAEYRLLVAFVDHPGQALTRERLLEITRARGVETQGRSIDLAVSRLRSKLGETDAHAGLIRTLRGTGYLFAPRKAP